MSVGGTIIEKRPCAVTDHGKAVQYWVVDRQGDETAVRAKPADIEPQVGDEIWWQSGRIYFDGDRQSLEKIANSFTPKTPRERLMNLADNLVDDILEMNADDLRAEMIADGISPNEVSAEFKRITDRAIRDAEARRISK